MTGRVFGAVWGSLMALLAHGGAASAGPPEAPLFDGVAVRVIPPAPVSYDATAFGRATHRLRLVATNATRKATTLPPFALRLSATRDGVDYPCRADEGRTPRVVEPGDSVTIERDVTCETPLPGRYEVDVRALGGRDQLERYLARVTLVIEASSGAPVRLPSDPRLWAAARSTHEIRPGSGEGTGARVFVALINGTTRDVVVDRSRGSVRVRREGAGTLACPERLVDLPFRGTLVAGRIQSVAIPFACDFSEEGSYEIEVALVTESGRLPISTSTMRVSRLPTPLPPPAGGMMGGR